MLGEGNHRKSSLDLHMHTCADYLLSPPLPPSRPVMLFITPPHHHTHTQCWSGTLTLMVIQVENIINSGFMILVIYTYITTLRCPFKIRSSAEF